MAEAAFLHPVAHRTTFRVVLALGPRGDVIDLAKVPSADEIVRGWTAQLDRGMRVEVPDEALAAAVQHARAHALLAGTRRTPGGRAVAALEDWGFDVEAADGWTRLGGRERRVARRRPIATATWVEVDEAIRIGEHDGLLLALRSILVRERDTEITLLDALPPHWRGQPFAVHDAPTRHGLLSYAVRWHGERPALLWEVPEHCTVRAPGLDPEWSADESSGEALLAPVGA